MDIHSAQFFISVYLSGSLSKAAREHFVTQPVISRAITSLEDEFNCTLFERSKHGVTPTKAGDAFYKYAKEYVEFYKSIAGGMSEYASKDNLTLSIAGITPPVREFLPMAVAAFNKKFPEITVTIDRYVASEMINIIEEDNYDFYITVMNDIKSHPELKSQLLLSEKLQLVTKKEVAPKNDKEAVALLKNNPIFLLPEEDASFAYQLSIDYLKKAGIKNPDLRPTRPYESLSFNVSADLGVAFLPAIHAFNEPDLYAYNIVGGPTLELGIAWKRETLPGHTFMNLLKKVLK